MLVPLFLDFVDQILDEVDSLKLERNIDLLFQDAVIHLAVVDALMVDGLQTDVHQHIVKVVAEVSRIDRTLGILDLADDGIEGFAGAPDNASEFVRAHVHDHRVVFAAESGHLVMSIDIGLSIATSIGGHVVDLSICIGQCHDFLIRAADVATDETLEKDSSQGDNKLSLRQGAVLATDEIDPDDVVIVAMPVVGNELSHLSRRPVIDGNQGVAHVAVVQLNRNRPELGVDEEVSMAAGHVDAVVHSRVEVQLGLSRNIHV